MSLCVPRLVASTVAWQRGGVEKGGGRGGALARACRWLHFSSLLPRRDSGRSPSVTIIQILSGYIFFSLYFHLQALFHLPVSLAGASYVRSTTATAGVLPVLDTRGPGVTPRTGAKAEPAVP